MTIPEHPPHRLTVNDAGSIWADGYKGQEAVLLDDYTGKLHPTQLFEVLDRWAFMMPIKRRLCSCKIYNGLYTYKCRSSGMV